MRGEVETYGMSYGGEDSGQVRGTYPETHRHTDIVSMDTTQERIAPLLVVLRVRIPCAAGVTHGRWCTACAHTHYTSPCGTTSCGGVTIHPEYVSTVWSNATYTYYTSVE